MPGKIDASIDHVGFQTATKPAPHHPVVQRHFVERQAQTGCCCLARIRWDLRAGPDLALTIMDMRHAVGRLHREVGQKWLGIRRGKPMRRIFARRLEIARSCRDCAGLVQRGCDRVDDPGLLRAAARGISSPLRLGRSHALACGPGVVGQHIDHVFTPDYAGYARNRTGCSLVDACQCPTKNRRNGDRGEFHARQHDVNAIFGSAACFGIAIEPPLRLADHAVCRGRAHRCVGWQGRCGGGGHECGIGKDFAAGLVHHGAVLCIALGR